jgi:hypothetical protein
LLKLPFGPTTFGATDSDVDEMLSARLERQQVLYEPSKRIRIVVLESALWARVCSPATLLEQLQRLLDLSSLRSLTFGIVRLDSSLPLIPMGGFTVYDTDLVVLETLSGEQQVSSLNDLNEYMTAFTKLAKAAVYGTDAARVLDKISAELRP